MEELVAEVLLEVAIKKPLDYAIPLELREQITPGCWVEVPLRRRLIKGYVASIKSNSTAPQLQPITRRISQGPVLTRDLFQLATWMASYYGAPIEKVITIMLPSGVRHGTQRKQQYFVTRAKTRDDIARCYPDIAAKAPQQAKVLDILLHAKKGLLCSQLLEEAGCQMAVIKALEAKGIVSLERVRTDQPLVVGETYFRSSPKELRPEQAHAHKQITQAIHSGTFSVKLLHGVTGSGKTEIYMRAIEETLSIGKAVLVLVPEISLTTQTIQRFKSRFNEPIAVLHHRISDGERHETWNMIQDSRYRIVIGARSAIFSPIPRLGLIVIDEEHESSYKQSDDSPAYHARDVGVMRGKLADAVVILGSATPSLESFHNAQLGKYELLSLTERAGSTLLPTVHIVDMKREYERANGMTVFSGLLLQKIEERVKKGEQSILFLNRRGYHTTCTCTQCASVISCPHCDCALTFHRTHNRLSCHLCGLEQPPPTVCPHCATPSMIHYRGIGTEKVQAMLHGILPSIRTLRADADSTKHKGSLEKILHDFRTGKADVLVGTQMIAKGLHFPEVTLVGILSCDGPLNIPDFRAQETVFQLITQVAGRSGRGSAPGEVILQTSLPHHHVIRQAAAQDYASFFQEESVQRRTFGFPPYTHIIKFIFSGEDKERVASAAATWSEGLRKSLPPQFICHPPLPCGHARVSDQWRYQCLVRGPSVSAVMSLAETLSKEIKTPSTVSKFCDVDPISTFF